MDLLASSASASAPGRLPRSLGIGPLADDAATDRGGQPGGQRRGGGRRRSRAPGGGRIGPAAGGGRGAAPRRAADHDQNSFDVAGIRSTAGANLYRDRVPDADAAAVARLRAAGAVILGKSNVPAFVADFQTYNAIYGVTNNPFDLARTPGGSSGGRRGGGGERDERLRARLRSRQLDPLAGPCLRPVRPEDDLEPRSPLRPRAAGPRAAHGPQPRPRRGGAPRPFGGGSRPRAQRSSPGRGRPSRRRAGPRPRAFASRSGSTTRSGRSPRR